MGKIKQIRLRYAVEVMVVVVVMLVLVSSYIARDESVVGKDAQEMVEMATEKSDYQVAQRLYEQEKVHGAVEDSDSLEMKIYPQKRIEAEIARVEALLDEYPTYPPLLTQLVKLSRMAGDQQKAEEYERELVRLGANTR